MSQRSHLSDHQLVEEGERSRAGDGCDRRDRLLDVEVVRDACVARDAVGLAPPVADIGPGPPVVPKLVRPYGDVCIDGQAVAHK